MKFRTMLGLAAIGGILYMHKKRGGEWTMDSFKDSAKQLWKGIEQNAEKAKKTAQQAIDDASRKAEKAVGTATSGIGSTRGDFRH